MNFEVRKDWTNSLCVIWMTACVLIGAIGVNQPASLLFLVIPFLCYRREVAQPWDLTWISLLISTGVLIIAFRCQNTFALVALGFSAICTQGFRENMRSFEW